MNSISTRQANIRVLAVTLSVPSITKRGVPFCLEVIGDALECSIVFDRFSENQFYRSLKFIKSRAHATGGPGGP